MSIRVKLKHWFFQDMPTAATSEGWRKWKMKARQQKVRWFLSDTLPMWFRSTFVWPVERVKDWVYYRTKRKFHVLKLDHKPGYIENGERMFYACFTILRRFVEVEKAWMQHLSDYMRDDDDFMFGVRRARRHKKEWKNADKRELAMKYLDWEISLGDSEDAKKYPDHPESQWNTAKAVKELYIWWMDVYPNRIEPYDNEYYQEYHRLRKERGVSGIGGFMADTDEDVDTKEEDELHKKAMKLAGELEEQYKKEDDEMFEKLVKIRHGMWT